MRMQGDVMAVLFNCLTNLCYLHPSYTAEDTLAFFIYANDDQLHASIKLPLVLKKN